MLFMISTLPLALFEYWSRTPDDDAKFFMCFFLDAVAGLVSGRELLEMDILFPSQC